MTVPGLAGAALAVLLAVGGHFPMTDRLSGLSERLTTFEADTLRRLSDIEGAIADAEGREWERLRGMQDARLEPGSLVPSGEDRSAVSMGSGLLARLRSDSAQASYAGSSMSALGSANLLADPLWDKGIQESSIGTGWSDLNPDWEMKLVNNYGGTTPLDAWWRVYRRRGGGSDLGTPPGGPRLYSSAQLQLFAGWPSAATIRNTTFYLRQKAVQTQPDLDWPYVVAATRIGPSGAPYMDDVITLEAWQQIVDGDTVIAESDPLDLLAMTADQEAQIFATATGAELWGAAHGYQYQLAIHAVGWSSRTVSLGVLLAEPQLNLSDEASPPPFQPAVGSWNPVPYLVGVRAFRNAVQSVGDGSWTAVSWNDESWDTDGFHSGSNLTRLIAPVSGYYRLGGTVTFAANASGVRGCRIVANGNVRGTHRFAPSPSGTTAVPIPTTEVNLLAGQYVEVEVIQGSGGNLDLSSGSDQTVVTMSLIAYRR